MVLCLPAEDHTTSPHARVCGSLLGFLIEIAIAALIVAAVVLAIKVAFYAVSGACQGVSGACQGRVRPGADGGCMTTSAIAASGLRKAFGDKTVLDGIDLDVPAGTVFSLLGPNGAGKTTTVNVLTTLMKADAGTVRVAGHDVAAETKAVRAAGCRGSCCGLPGDGCRRHRSGSSRSAR